MAGNSIDPRLGRIVTGKYGQYLLSDRIGKGGNGTVYSVNIIEDRGLPRHIKGYAIKALDITSENEGEQNKKRNRFIKEIENVLSFQDKIRSVFPIYDTSNLCDKNQDQLWYLMPKAVAFNPQYCSLEQRLQHMISLGNCLQQLHNLGYAHRDIKPKNLLYYQGRVYLADFGLIWNMADTNAHITDIRDHLGPLWIRPPELQFIGDINRVDYRKSDVYLYAKTIWMIFQCNGIGFPAEYSRTDEQVYIDKEKYKLETAEPLHRLMEGATRHDYWERIDIDACLYYLEEQKSIINQTIPKETLQEYKYAEQTKRVDATVIPYEKTYTDSSAILQTLIYLSKASSLVFISAGQEFCRIPLRKVFPIRDNIFEIEVFNPYQGTRRKTIQLAIEWVRLTKDKEVVIKLNTLTCYEKPMPEYTQIMKALESPDNRIRLNAEYMIRVVP